MSPSVYVPVPSGVPSSRERVKRAIPTFAKLKEKPIIAAYIKLHCICFFLYVVLGKGFAYTGYPPFFIGEALILAGCCVAATTRKASILFQSTLGLWLTGFAVWQICCTIPYFPRYGMDTLRDAMLWGYSAIAWVIAAVILRSRGGLDTVTYYYRKFAGLLITLAIAAYLITFLIPGSLPRWPGSLVSIPYVKAGDSCVHLAGAIGFFLAGLCSRKVWWLVPAVIGFLAAGVGNRGGMVAFIVAMMVALVLFPKPSKLVPVVGGMLLVLTFLMVFDVEIKMPGSGAKTFSAHQIFENVSSLAGMEDKSAQGGLDETKQWRLAWWNTIIDYTFHGPLFWTGKGFGVNLMVDDGVGRNENSFPGLRSPHNSHLTYLARSGVPGVSIWLILQFTWAGAVFRAYRKARKQGSEDWARFMGWLLTYWTAFMVNASFDVSFEGPVAAIPFWTVFGLGWAACIKFSQEGKLLRPA